MSVDVGAEVEPRYEPTYRTAPVLGLLDQRRQVGSEVGGRGVDGMEDDVADGPEHRDDDRIDDGNSGGASKSTALE